jgi:hypothetical protein
MPEKKKEETVKTVRMSSAYTRRVGNATLNVYNTKQTPGLTKKAYDKKWVVIQQTGNRSKIIGQTDKKYDSIDILLAAEIGLKEAAKKASESNDS